MYSFNKFLSLILILTIIASCEKESFNPNETKLDFMNIEIGAKAYYERIESNCVVDVNFCSSGTDTIVWEVIGQSLDSFKILEYYTPNSKLVLDGFAPEPIDLTIIDRTNYLLFPDRGWSNLMFFYGNDTLFHRAEPNVLLEQNDCVINIDEELFIGNEIGTISNFDYCNIDMKDCKVVSCVPGSFNIDAYLFYSENSLDMSYVLNAFGQNITAWHRIF